MTEKFQVFTSEKPSGVSLEDAQADMEARFPAYEVEVHEVEAKTNEEGEEVVPATFVAKLTRKHSAPKVPPFLEEKDDEEAPTDKSDSADSDDDAPDDEGDIDEKDTEEKAPKKDKGEGKGDPVSQAIDALNTLKSVLPKLEPQLKELAGDVDIPTEPMKPPGGGPDVVGPTPGNGGPGLPEGLPGGPGGPGGGPPMGGPAKGRGLDMRRGPSVGVPTFSKTLHRPAKNDDGKRVSMVEAASEIAAHPKYAHYEVVDLRLDPKNDVYVAELKLREE